MAAPRDGFTEDGAAGGGAGARAGARAGIYDRFRARIMFPLADARGRVLGFGARAMRDDQGAKYLNTSESELFHKGRQLFGIDLARAAAAKAGRVIVVEGYTDVLALHQAGVTRGGGDHGHGVDAGADGRARPVRRQHRASWPWTPIAAGQEAMLRAARVAEERGVELRVVQMPEGADPADLVAAAAAPRRSPAGSSGRCRCLSSRCGGCSPTLISTSRKAGTGRWTEARAMIGRGARGTPQRRDALVRHVADRLDVPVGLP